MNWKFYKSRIDGSEWFFIYIIDGFPIKCYFLIQRGFVGDFSWISFGRNFIPIATWVVGGVEYEFMGFLFWIFVVRSRWNSHRVKSINGWDLAIFNGHIKGWNHVPTRQFDFHDEWKFKPRVRERTLRFRHNPFHYYRSITFNLLAIKKIVISLMQSHRNRAIWVTNFNCRGYRTDLHGEKTTICTSVIIKIVNVVVLHYYIDFFPCIEFISIVRSYRFIIEMETKGRIHFLFNERMNNSQG